MNLESTELSASVKLAEQGSGLYLIAEIVAGREVATHQMICFVALRQRPVFQTSGGLDRLA